jgi:hypothetical protein
VAVDGGREAFDQVVDDGVLLRHGVEHAFLLVAEEGPALLYSVFVLFQQVERDQIDVGVEDGQQVVLPTVYP